MTSNIKFSVLIPVYNVEKYLEQCINSVLRQSYKNYEVILVDDGSTDNSGSICDKYAEKYNQIKVYHKENEGLLLTRRYSIKLATGDFILFLDSDDYWEDNLIDTVYKTINKYECDMVLYRYCRVTDNGDKIYDDTNVFKEDTIFELEKKQELFNELVKNSRLNTLWSKAVRRDIFDMETNYYIYKDKKGEDILQSLPLIKNAKKIVYINDVLYNYRHSLSGRGRNIKIKYLDDFDVVRNIVLKYLNDMGYSNKEILKEFYNFYQLSILRFAKSIIISNENMEIIERAFFDAKNKPLYIESKKYKNKYSFEDKICLYLFNKSRYKTLKSILIFRQIIKNIIVK